MSSSAVTWEGDIAEEQQTVALASALSVHVRAGDLLVLSGGLGAGKTFFSRALCYALGLDREERVTSPTFTLVQEYPTTPLVVHADLYRLSREEEVYELGLDVRRSEGALLLVEWGAPFVEALGGGALFVDLSVEPRRAHLHGTSSRSQAIITALRDSGLVSSPEPSDEKAPI